MLASRQPPLEPHVVLEPGRYAIVADVHDRPSHQPDAETLAHARRLFDFEQGGNSAYPFRIERETASDPVWRLVEPNLPGGEWRLLYAGEHPLRLAAEAADSHWPERNGFYGTNAFLSRMYCEAFLEWARRTSKEYGDDGGFNALLDKAAGRTGDDWDRLRERLELLRDEEPDEPVRLHREVVSLMTYLFQGSL